MYQEKIWQDSGVYCTASQILNNFILLQYKNVMKIISDMIVEKMKTLNYEKVHKKIINGNINTKDASFRAVGL